MLESEITCSVPLKPWELNFEIASHIGNKSSVDFQRFNESVLFENTDDFCRICQ